MRPADEEKLRKTFWIAVLLGILIIGYYIFFIEPNALTVKRMNLDIGLNESVKIVFIADIHIETISDEFLERVIETANAEEADYILLGGDYTDSISFTRNRLAPLQNLNSKKDIYTVLGNHDYGYYEMTRATSVNETGGGITQFFESAGIIVLRNEGVDTGDFILVGVDNEWACKDDYEKAIEGVDFSGTTILVTHDQEAVPRNEFVKWDLILVGHTHCGQVRLPLIGSVPKLFGFRGEYDAGYYEFEDGGRIYTTCGIGGGPRFLAPPEITVIELS